MPSAILTQRMPLKPFAVVSEVPPGPTPPAVAGYTDWWVSSQFVYEDAGGTDTAENSDIVLNWTSSAGTGRALVKTGSNNSFFLTNLVNGFPAVRNNGASSEMAVTLALPQPFTVIMALCQDSYNSVFRLWGKGGDGPHAWQSPSSGSIALYAGNVSACSNSGLAIGTWGVVSFVVNGSSSSIKVNGGSRTTGNPGTQGMTSFALGHSASNAAGASYAEIVLYPSALSTTNEAAVMDAWRTKYGTA